MERDAAEAEDRAREVALAEATATTVAGRCPVVGCTNLGLCRHDTDSGVIYLCGRCDQVARRNLQDAANHEAILEALAAPVKRAMLLREKQRSR